MPENSGHSMNTITLPLANDRQQVHDWVEEWMFHFVVLSLPHLSATFSLVLAYMSQLHHELLKRKECLFRLSPLEAQTRGRHRATPMPFFFFSCSAALSFWHP